MDDERDPLDTIREILNANPKPLGYRIMSVGALSRASGLPAEEVLAVLDRHLREFRQSPLSVALGEPVYALQAARVHWRERWALLRWYMGLPFGWINRS
ncbi:MAG: hypothetical protein ACP5QO_13510 [Clostridia bacterium]